MLDRSVRQQTLLNAYWIPTNFQTSALLAISIPKALLDFSIRDYVGALAFLASIIGAVSMLAPPLAGAWSDRLRRSGVPRRPFVIAGAIGNAAGLIWMAAAPSSGAFAAAVILAALAQNVSAAAYQALIPEVVGRADWGTASGYQGVAVLVGSIAGLAVAGTTSPHTTFEVAAVITLAGAMTLYWVRETLVLDEEHAHVKNWHDFSIAVTSRFWTNLGLSLLGTYVLFYFHDVLHVDNPKAGTSIAAGMTMVGAIVSSLWLGSYSDRVERKHVVAFAGIPMSIAAIGFALAPQERWIFAYALFFGVGLGGIVSTGWALALDSVPRLRNVARDLGIWGIISNLPYAIAPLIGAWILHRYASVVDGYRALFIAAGISFILGSVVVLWVGKRAVLPPSGGPLQAFAMAVIHPYYLSAYRIRGWGRLPFWRGATLAISNHQHDLDTTAVIMRLSVQGPWHRPIYAVASRRLFEPGFMCVGIPQLELIVRRMNWGKLFSLIGMVPIENELRKRSVASITWAVYRRHGDVRLDEIFLDGVLDGVRPQIVNARASEVFTQSAFRETQKTYVSLSAVRDPYRIEIVEETRQSVTTDLARIENVLRGGGTLYLTPEGRYSRDGRIGRFRTALERTAKLAEVYVLPVSYDPFVGRRLSLLYRVLKAQDPDDLRSSLAAPRTVVVSQLLATWLLRHSRPFTAQEAIAGVRDLLAGLPAEAFVDPELARDPDRMTDFAIEKMTCLHILLREKDRYELGPTRTHPQFPNVADIVAHQANFFEETIQALHKLARKD